MASGTIDLSAVSSAAMVHNTSLSISSTNYNSIDKSGRVCILNLSVNYNTAQTFPAGTWTQIGTVPSGYVPSKFVLGTCALHTNNGSIANAMCQIRILENTGAVEIQPLVGHTATTTLKLLRAQTSWFV